MTSPKGKEVELLRPVQISSMQIGPKKQGVLDYTSCRDCSDGQTPSDLFRSVRSGVALGA